MVATPTVDVSQLRKLSLDMRDVPAEARVIARRVVQKFCADTKRDAQILAPVDTGALRNSITYETSSNGRDIVGIVGPTVNYGIYVELGTSRMTGQPFLAPAFDRHAPYFELALREIGVLK